MRRLSVLVLLGVLVAAPLAASFSVPKTSHAALVAGLEDMLKLGLQARTPGDRKFITKVVNLVRANKLSRKMVTETFQYVRNKVTSNRRALVFQILIRKRALKLGVKI